MTSSTLEEECIRLAERSLEAGLFDLPAPDGHIAVLTAFLLGRNPVLRETTVMGLEAAASYSRLTPQELREQLQVDRGLLVVLVLHGPEPNQERALSIALHRPWQTDARPAKN